MGTQSQTEFIAQKKMLPPQPGRFQDREDLITYVRDFGADQGYVVTIKKSRKDRRVILGCDRGGVYRNRRKVDENRRKRKASSRLINCPFEAIGKKEDDIWTLTIKNGDHNHEPLKDMSEHPYSRRFTEDEVRQIKLMTEAGVKPRQVLKALKQHNPELQSTPRHLYNLKAKIRQGNLSEKSIKAWRPNISVSANNSHTFIGDSVEKNLLMKLPNFIGGEFLDSHNCSMVDVINPATQEVVSQVPLTTYEEFKAAVSAAKQAFPLWKNTPISTRRRIMFKFQELILRDVDKLAMNIVTEQGKTLKGAQGDVLRGLEVVEHTCGLATMQMGEFIPNASDGIDTYCLREPLGVCAGICAFNSLATISLWMFPVAVTCGNTFVLKPCEKNPGVSMLLAALAVEAGLPDGVLNIVHGTHDIINYICDDEDIKAVSFAGSNSVGTDVYARAAAAGKQVQSNTGGKNYAIIMPDANMEASLSALIAAGFGAAEQRCMALSTVVSIGSSIPWEEKVVEYAKVLKVDVGTDPNADLGPVITKEVKDRLCRLVHSSVESGARLLLDGRDIVVPGYENGNFIGPTILSDVTTDMECYKEEFLGPVLLFMQVDNLEEAISLVNRNKNKIGASIFTTSSMHARKFQSEVEVGMVGINVAVPVPLPSSSFNDKAGLEFYTQLKRVAQQCKNFPSIGVSLAVPSSSETDLRAQGVPWMFTSTSGQIILPPLPSASERDSPGIGVPNPPLSEIDLTNQRATSSSPSPSPSPDRGLSTYDSLSLMTHGHDSIVPSCTIDSSSERLYMLATSHLNDSISQTLQRTDTSLFSSERLYMPPTSQRNDHIGLASQTNIALESTSDRIYLSSTSQRDDNMASATSQQAETLASTSERIYIPPLVHRNAGMAAKSEWLCVPTSAASQRMYPRGPIISADEYPSQGPSLTLPSSQRI